MKQTKKHHKAPTKLITASHLKNPKAILFMLAFVAIGTVLIFASRAAGSFASLDAGASNTLTSGATSVTDASAFGGSVVQFGNTGSSSGTGEFRIVGRDIVDPNGNKYFPIGANLSVKIIPVQYVFEGNTGTSTGRSADVQAWGWNTVRATIICVADTPTKQQIYDGLDTFIREYTAKKIVVMIECHDMTAGSGNDSNTNLMANQWVPALQTFWTDMANKYKTNPYVWFNTANEPMGWTNGQWSNWLTFQTNFYNLIRGTGAKNIFVADIPFWGQDLSFLANDTTIINWAKSKCNALFSTHVYGGAGNYTQTGQYMQQIVNSGVPLISGEFGVDVRTPNDQNRRDAANAVIDFGRAYGIGALWWHGNGDTNTEVFNSLKKIGYPTSVGAAFFVDGNPNNLSEFGQKFWDLSHSPPNLGKFTGNYALSNCN